MDVDGDIDSQLLQQFSSIQTTDRDVLVAELQRLLGNQLNDDGCVFFLDMNNWNLQAAVCSYFEYGQASAKIPQMSFVKDITIGEGESVPPSTKFSKTWRVQNSGDEVWPYGSYLKFVSGDRFGETECVMVDPLSPGACTDITVDMVSPMSTGVYQGEWRMCTANGLFFGEPIWVILPVEEGGVLGVTQLLSQFGCSEQIQERQRDTADHSFHLQSVRTDLTAALEDAGIQEGEMLCGRAELGPGAPSVNSPRHSSLPSSPRWLGELGSNQTHFTDESRHQRPILFQTPDNSPSKTICSSKKMTNCTDVDSMETS